MGWGNKWPSHMTAPWPNPKELAEPLFVGVDLGSGDKTAYFTEAGPISKQAWNKLKTKYERNNKVPTHDPHTNPDAHVYYSCECGEVFDPGTKSFAALNNAAQHTKWVIAWGSVGYVAKCPKCAQGLAIND